MQRKTLPDRTIIGDGDELVEVIDPFASLSRFWFYARNRRLVRRYHYEQDGRLVSVLVIVVKRLVPSDAKVIQV